MDKQSLHETAKRLALELPFVELCWPFGPEFDVFKIGGKIFMLSSELRGVSFIQQQPMMTAETGLCKSGESEGK